MRKVVAAPAVVLFAFFWFLLDVMPESDVITAPMEETEQNNLYLAIQGFVGNQWNGSELYPDPCGWTPIQGVSCDTFEELWYVTVISIGPIFDNSLKCIENADFSPSLFDLKHLRRLSIFNCFTSENQSTSIPSQGWQKLTGSLETLEFRSNRGLMGVIPSSLGMLTHLQSLVIEENSVMGELPQELGKLVNLKRLSLGRNRFSGWIPASFGQSLAELLILDISSNSLTGSLPAYFGSMGSLLKLDLSNNGLSGNLPAELGKLRNLTLLDLRNNNFSGGLSESVQGMASLQELMLTNNPLGGTIMGIGWTILSNLTAIDLSNTGLSGSIPDSITQLRRLRYLALDNNHLSGSISPKLADLPCLTTLYLQGNNFIGELDFSEEFYERFGRRFASWDNPHLCYIAGPTSRGHVPLGVEQCKH